MSWKTFVRAGASFTRPTAGCAGGASSAIRVNRLAGFCVASASAVSDGYMSMKVCTTRGSRALPASWRSSEAHRFVVQTLRHQSVGVVDDGENPRAERHFFALQPRGMPVAAPPLVVAQDERRDRIGGRHAADDLGAHLRVNADLLELCL